MSEDPPFEPGHSDVGVDEIGEVVRFDVVGHGDGLHVLHVVGEIDTLTAPLLRSRLVEELKDVTLLVVDMTDVTFRGSAGLAALVAARDDAAAGSVTLRLVPGSRIVARALEATGLLSLFDIAVGVPQALEIAG